MRRGKNHTAIGFVLCAVFAAPSWGGPRRSVADRSRPSDPSFLVPPPGGGRATQPFRIDGLFTMLRVPRAPEQRHHGIRLPGSGARRGMFTVEEKQRSEITKDLNLSSNHPLVWCMKRPVHGPHRQQQHLLSRWQMGDACRATQVRCFLPPAGICQEEYPPHPLQYRFWQRGITGEGQVTQGFRIGKALQRRVEQWEDASREGSSASRLSLVVVELLRWTNPQWDIPRYGEWVDVTLDLGRSASGLAPLPEIEMSGSLAKPKLHLRILKRNTARFPKAWQAPTGKVRVSHTYDLLPVAD